MARVTIVLDLPNTAPEELVDPKHPLWKEWHPTGKANVISVDNAYLTADEEEDDFYMFEVVSVEASK